MKIGFSFLSLKTLSVKRAISITKKLGGNTLELFGDLVLFYRGKFCEKPESIKEFAVKNDIFLTMHLPYIDINLASFNDEIWEKSIESILKAIEYGEKAGIKRAVLHPGGVPLSHLVLIFLAQRRLRKALEFILEKAEKYDVEVCIENPYFEENDIFSNVDQFYKFIKGFGGKLKVCFDFGHAHISKKGIDYSLNLLKPFITHVHIHDNHGEKDEHLSLGKGSIDFKKYLDFLRNFDGTIILEINSLKDKREDLKRSVEIIKGEV
ncbi:MULTISPECIES: sugar phosphate isomerase/epimerase family protein [Dictyoglomus]|jgi:sugar phosphate isomerase/epimerase|uniref:Xylose isomerase domain protein TIM barrel n=1 Tax=Dictyoglomus turgidum (strain DSM 6724 / Z-1310) TaxID=515635 RepID=B8DYJ2_DICTD|nr:MULTISPECIES: sugar phosphate isomerase/epimerase family protein [Dictyoglomus]ACK41374.1 Xylose isomerase domain protein TIM barrel [Dictyoglomus turgidum DSM 6724]PNV80955.1 MAG: xylose isomerase [Dictyoglomus turgidum]HBU31621.1 xylose isomerase [Dictyoglomus sp.]